MLPTPTEANWIWRLTKPWRLQNPLQVAADLEATFGSMQALHTEFEDKMGQLYLHYQQTLGHKEHIKKVHHRTLKGRELNSWI